MKLSRIVNTGRRLFTANTVDGDVVPIPNLPFVLSQTKVDVAPKTPALLNWIWVVEPAGSADAIMPSELVATKSYPPNVLPIRSCP